MSQMEESRELPSLANEVKHNYDEMRENINKIKFKIEVHFNHEISKKIIPSLNLLLETFSTNIKVAENMLDDIYKEDKSQYTFHDLDKLHMVLPLLIGIKIPISKLNLQIYEYLENKN